MSIFKPKDASGNGAKHTPQHKDIESALPAEVEAASDACVSNAEDLVKGAELLLASSLSNIAYHLAVAALEEVGKSETLGMMHQARLRKGDLSERYLDDHVRKLFWALWGPSFGQQVISGPQLEFYKGLATEIHETRMRGLYVEPNEPTLVQPRDVVSKQKAETIVSMARARLELAKLRQPATLNDEQRKMLAWFLTTSEDSEKRNLLFSKKSMEKLAEVHDVKKWMKWCYDQFQEADAVARDLTEKELKRQEPSGDEAAKEKWKMKVRIVSDSHSIRPKELNSWNALSAPIKLFPVGGNHRNELICEITFPAAVPAEGLLVGRLGCIPKVRDGTKHWITWIFLVVPARTGQQALRTNSRPGEQFNSPARKVSKIENRVGQSRAHFASIKSSSVVFWNAAASTQTRTACPVQPLPNRPRLFKQN